MVGAGYVNRNDGWTLGENLAWGTGKFSTARGVHDAWMQSPGHRANILKPAYRELGIGIRVGVPERRRRRCDLHQTTSASSDEAIVRAVMTYGFADLGDVRLHYVEAGAGPLVVLLHGFPEFWYSWRAQIEPLAAAGFRVVAPDMRGYNLSSKPSGRRRTTSLRWRATSGI